MEVLLKQVAQVLAYNTNYATMVTAPNYKKTVKFIQLSQVDINNLLAVIVVDGNIIKNHMIHVDEALDNEDVLKFNILLNTFLQGASLEDINLEMIQAMKAQAGDYASILENIFQGIVEAIHEANEVEIYTSGATNILKYPELGDISKTSELLEKFEDKSELSHMLEETISKDEDGNETGIQIYIGDEAPAQNMKDCSLVTATYKMPEGATGTIGIIGPKRMDYKKVVSTLKNLTIELDDIFKKGKEVKEDGKN
jgi:heat-inducible transcriptional repressor